MPRGLYLVHCLLTSNPGIPERERERERNWKSPKANTRNVIKAACLKCAVLLWYKISIFKVSVKKMKHIPEEQTSRSHSLQSQLCQTGEPHSKTPTAGTHPVPMLTGGISPGFFFLFKASGMWVYPHKAKHAPFLAGLLLSCFLPLWLPADSVPLPPPTPAWVAEEWRHCSSGS
jgi:hypothetical protein